MDPAPASRGVLMQTVDHWIWIIGTGIDLFGVMILLAAIGWTSHLFVKRSMGEQLCTFTNNSFWLISVQLLDGVWSWDFWGTNATGHR